MNKFDYCKAVLFGSVLAAIFLSVFLVFGNDKPNKQPITSKSNFEVVDTYKGCDLVRWTNNQLAEYKYVLYCPQK